MASKLQAAPPLDAENADPDRDTNYDFPRDLIGYGRHPPKANWPNGAKIAVSFVINYEEVRCAWQESRMSWLTCRREQNALS